MTAPVEQYPFVQVDPAAGAASLMPYLPLTLSSARQSVRTSGLLDTGAAVNVLPRALGEQFGAVWEQQMMPVRLGGGLAGVEARVLVVTAVVGQFPPVRLAFAWAQTDGMPLLLGQVNFFMEFEVCLYRARSVFDIRPK